MPARQASFGGVVALFGSADDDDDATPAAPTTRKQQPSFGGVASLFGTGDDDDAGAVSAPAPKARGQQPSFGGVAAMFGDPNEDEKPPTQIITKKPKSGSNRTASFGGVADLFGGDKSDEEDGPPAGNVANMFSASGSKDTVGALPPAAGGKKQRKGKRDHSVSGVFGLFGDEEDAPKQDSVDRNSIHDQLRKQSKVEEIRVRQLGAELEQAEIETKELEDRMKQIQIEMENMKQTKLALITSTAKEIDRMRQMLRLYRGGEKTEEGKAATVS